MKLHGPAKVVEHIDLDQPLTPDEFAQCVADVMKRIGTKAAARPAQARAKKKTASRKTTG